MKKQLLVGAFMLASVLTANAQTILSQDFEGATTGWGVSDFDGDGKNFGIYNSNATLVELGITGKTAGSANFTANADNTFTPIDNADNVISSPAVAIPAGAANLTFRVGSFSITEDVAAANYSVYVLTPADLEGATTAAQFKAVVLAKTATLTSSVTDSSEIKTIDLTPFAGSEVIVAFRHHNNAEAYAYFFVDDIVFAQGAPAGVNENLLASLSVFPNPANDVVNVTNAENILVNGITVTDLNGRTVKTSKYNGVANAQINISDLASGVYMLTVSSDKGSLTKKIVKN